VNLLAAAQLYVPPGLIQQGTMAKPRRMLPATYFDGLEILVLFPGAMLVRPCHADDGSYIRVGGGAVGCDTAGKVEGNCESWEVPLTR
jgi:hypothetical protein